MFGDSVGGGLGIVQGSIMNFGGSIGQVVALGLGSLTDGAGTFFDSLATGSRVVAEEDPK